MPSSSVAVRGLALAVLAIGAPAFGQDVVVRPTRVAGAVAPGTYERNLPAPPAGPIESRPMNDPAFGTIARRTADQKLRHLELRAFAADTGPDSRKVALARALVVCSYVIDRGVKSRIEVGSFSGDGDSVEILVPST